RAAEAREHVAGRYRDAEREDRGQCRNYKAIEDRLDYNFLTEDFEEVLDGEIGPAMHVVDGIAWAQRRQYQPEHWEGEQQANRDDYQHEERALAAWGQRLEKAARPRRGDGLSHAHFDTSTQRFRMR